MNPVFNLNAEGIDYILKLEVGTRVKIPEELFSSVSNIIGDSYQCGIDLYCPECKDKKTFTIMSTDFYHSAYNFLESIHNSFSKTATVPGSNKTKSSEIFKKYNGKFDLELTCPICKKKIYFYYVYEDGCIMKVFTYPNLMDGLKFKYRKYQQINNKKFKYDIEFVTGLFLYYKSNSGIGSYCYLRRCLENYVLDYIEENIASGKISEADVLNIRFSEKVELIKENIDEDLYLMIKPLYGILSKGIHELDENVCLNEFEHLKDVVEILLDDKLERIEMKKKKEKMQKYLEKKHEELK